MCRCRPQVKTPCCGSAECHAGIRPGECGWCDRKRPAKTQWATGDKAVVHVAVRDVESRGLVLVDIPDTTTSVLVSPKHLTVVDPGKTLDVFEELQRANRDLSERCEELAAELAVQRQRAEIMYGALREISELRIELPQSRIAINAMGEAARVQCRSR